MPAGTIKTYVADRGFGFLRPDNEAADVFFHISSVVGDDWTPAPGERCTFENGVDPKSNRVRAQKVTLA